MGHALAQAPFEGPGAFAVARLHVCVHACGPLRVSLCTITFRRFRQPPYMPSACHRCRVDPVATVYHFLYLCVVCTMHLVMTDGCPVDDV